MTIIRTLILLSLLTRSCLWSLPAPIRDTQSLAILNSRDYCYRKERISSDQRLTLERQRYDNFPYVHRYVHCFWTQLQMWQDASGFDPMRIVNQFGGPQRLNAEQAVPAINNCNIRSRRPSRTGIEWCYLAFACVLHTPVGNWYRMHMQDVINGNA